MHVRCFGDPDDRLRPAFSGRARALLRALCTLLLVTLGGAAASAEFRPGGLDLAEVGRRLRGSDGMVAGCLAAGADLRALEPSVGTGEVAKILGILRRSETASALLDLARSRRVHVCLDGATRLLAYYFAGVRVIGLNSRLTYASKVLFLAHELGHVPQHPVYSDNRYFPPEDLIRLRRMREAGAEALATRIAWELRGAGHPEVWREKLRTYYGDVARAFQDALGAGALGDAPGSSRRLDRATRAAFDRWFAAAWRRRVYDRMTVEHLERISGDALGLVPARRRLDHEFLLGLGRIGGRNFLAGTDGARLDAPVYGGAMAAELESRLRQVLDRAQVSTAPDTAAVAPELGS